MKNWFRPRRAIGAKIIAGLGGLGLLAFIATVGPVNRAISQGTIQLTTLTGAEQINVSLPCTVFCYTTTATLKSYIGGGGAGGNGVNAQTGTSYTFVTADAGKLVTFSNTGSVAVTLPVATTAGFGAGTVISVENKNSGVVTITPATSTINGAATFVLEQNRGAVIVSDGTNYQTQAGGSGFEITPAIVSEGGTGLAAGTSGGVPCFASTSTMASSALLASGIVVTGGGAATCPSTTGSATFNAGTTTVTPSIDQTGTLNTTAVAGGHEFDGTTFYDSIAASTRGARVDEQYQYLTATYTLTSQTGAQQVLNGTTNGAFAVLAATDYRFECIVGLTSLSATSNSFGWAWGALNSASLTAQYWVADAQKGGTSLATAGAMYETFNAAANTALTAASTGTTGSLHVYGQLRVNAAGSLQPQISMQTAAAAVVAVGSGCRVWPVGPSATAVLGNWN
jgi:hypothetical protein